MKLNERKFSDEKIKQILGDIAIFDSGNKFRDVSNHFKQISQRVSNAYIMDDSIEDLHSMRVAVNANFHNDNRNIKYYHNEPGKFNWPHILKEIKKSKIVSEKPLLRKQGIFANKDALGTNPDKEISTSVEDSNQTSLS